MLKLMYITNNPQIALIAEKYGVDRIWIDLETLGKDERQINMNSVKSHHKISDIKAIAPLLTKSEMLVRVNPWNKNSVDEINQVIEAGAELIMLPMWKKVEEVSAFIDTVNKRVKTVLLLETKDAAECLDSVLALDGIDEIHIGLNDLHISYGLRFMFELLTNGTVENICRKINSRGIPYGFGGVAKIGEGLLPAEKIILEHYRLGSQRVILSRSFCNTEQITSLDEIDKIFRDNITALRKYEMYASDADESVLLKNKEDVRQCVGNIVASISRARREMNSEQLRQLVASYGDAFYILDSKQFRINFSELKKAFTDIYDNFNIAYSYKTNYTPKLCKIINELGGYAEVVSDMEMEIALRLGVEAKKIIWNGPYKNYKKVEELLLTGGTVNLDSEYEIDKIRDIAERYPNHILNIGIRVNFDIGDSVTSRFGFDIRSQDFKEVLALVKGIENINLMGIQCHFATRRLETWKPRAEKMLALLDELEIMPEHIDLGGGLFGKMEESLKEQFDSKIPNYIEYANEVAPLFAEHYKNRNEKPLLLIEPGSALVGDCMKFVSRVVNIKEVRGKSIATLLGSIYNINPTLNKKNPPITVYSMGKEQRDYTDLDFGGFTCIESDYLYRHYAGKLAKDDMVVFGNVGSYSIVLKPPFILPNFPIIDLVDTGVELIKRSEVFDDLFHTFSF